MSEKWKQKILLIFPFAVLAAGMIFTAAFFLHTYRQIAFEHTSALCETILANSPEAEPQLLAALKDYHSLTEQELRGNDYLEKYGYRVDDFCYDFPLDTVLFPILFFLVTACAFGAGTFLSHRKNRKRIDDLTEYLEQVNIGAGGTLIQAKEDEYSHLQDEIYKTVTMLYQTRETAVAAKKNFAENLANIAHQLKTPITAAFLSLQLMEKEIPGAYAEQVKQQLKRLNRLEESLLMLSKIDAGTLPLKREKVDLYTVLNLAADNLNDLLRKNHITVEIPENGCIEFWGDLEWTMESLPSQLSGGQQQRVAIARSLIYRPALLLADEPTGNLDRKNGEEIIDLLKLSNRNLEQTILLITHDEKIALEADRVITIEDGKIVGDQKRR